MKCILLSAAISDPVRSRDGVMYYMTASGIIAMRAVLEVSLEGDWVPADEFTAPMDKALVYNLPRIRDETEDSFWFRWNVTTLTGGGASVTCYLVG
jgi:hypothetical protein